MSYQQVQKYEKGISPITVERLLQIAKALEIAPADFLVNKFEEAGLLKAYKSIGSKRLRQSILVHIKTVAKIGKGTNV